MFLFLGLASLPIEFGYHDASGRRDSHQPVRDEAANGLGHRRVGDLELTSEFNFPPSLAGMELPARMPVRSRS